MGKENGKREGEVKHKNDGVEGERGMEGKNGTPRVGSHPHVRNPEKFPGCA